MLSSRIGHTKLVNASTLSNAHHDGAHGITRSKLGINLRYPLYNLNVYISTYATLVSSDKTPN